MAKVLLSQTATEDLAWLIRTHTLPADTVDRVKRVLRPLARFPRLGAQLEGRWRDHRFLLGPWRWMLIVYLYDEVADEVLVVAMQDGRTSNAVTAVR